MTIKIFNTLTNKKEDFVSIKKKLVKMYVCGPTVYNYIHIGNARAFVFFDVVRRYLEHSGYKVEYVQNLTDIDDKLINAASESNEAVNVIAERFIEAFYEDMDALGTHRATHHPKATDYIAEMIEFITKLIESGFAYEANGSVYFRSAKAQDYGKLSKQPLEDLKTGARVDANEDKESPLDFTLWKVAKEDDVNWDTPWGKGRPGWHTECAVMSQKLLAETIDIHAAGVDLCFPHHENEIAQAEALTGKQFANYWMHNGFINFGNEKMSKSLGNVHTVRDLLKRYSASALRYFLLSTHYRNPVQYTEEIMAQAEKSVEKFNTVVRNLNHRLQNFEPTSDKTNNSVDEIDKLIHKFEIEMHDDFNTSNAITALFELVKVANQIIEDNNSSYESLKLVWDKLKIYGEDILGLMSMEVMPSSNIDEMVEKLIEEREEARKAKDFSKADQIRDQLTSQGVSLEDTPQGVRWTLNKE